MLLYYLGRRATRYHIGYRSTRCVRRCIVGVAMLPPSLLLPIALLAISSTDSTRVNGLGTDKLL